MLNFFDAPAPIELDDYRAKPAPFNKPRAITGAAEPMKLNSTNQRERVDKRKVQAWQTAAWQFFDQIGEIKFAFSLVGQIISQVRIYAAYVQSPDSPPVKVDELVKKLDSVEQSTSHKTRDAAKAADDVVTEFIHTAFNGISSFMREAAINVSVPGEFYLAHHKGKWHCVSSDELVGTQGNYKLRTDRTSNQADEDLAENAYVARVWRAHPRFSKEPDSSMLGVLDQCEQLVLLDQAMRVITRSRLNAGALFIPDGVGAANLEASIAEAASNPVEDESAMNSVVPLLLRGPAELGKEIKYVELARKVDAEMLEQQSRALDRVLAGVDIPKDIVQGLSNARYSNAIVITDEMFKSHIEPLIIMLCDALTTVMLHTQLRKNGIDEDLVRNLVVWYDPSDIVTRPDRSQAANDGYDRKVLSAHAWRSARGFNEMDAPDSSELRERLALEKAMIPPEMAAPLIEAIDPKFFEKERQEAQEESGMPADVQQILDPNSVPPVPGQPEPVGPPDEGPQDDLGGGEISQGGFMPPRTAT